MSTKRISQLNFYQKIGPDQLKWQIGEIDTAIFNRLQASMYQPGIVSSTDPHTDTSLWNIVFNSGIVTIGSGTAISENGMYLEQTEAIDVTMPSYTVPSTWLVVVEGIVDSTDTQQNEFGVIEPVYYEVVPSVNIVEATTTWQDITIWSEERKSNSVIVGVLRIGTIDGTETTTVDYATEDYDNRQWFSMADYDHRNEKGSGNDSVPHNIALTDLSDGDITIYNQLRANGFVLAKDTDIGSVAGTKCEALFVPSDFKVDTTGEITGITNAQYVKAPHYIERLVHASDTADNPVCLIHLEKSNVVYLMPTDLIPASGINVWYTRVGSLAPIVDFSKYQVLFDTSLDGEVVVGNGRASVIEETFSFDTLTVGPMPKKWNIWWDGTKTLSQTDPLSCPTLLESIGTTEQIIDENKVTLDVPNNVVVGLADVNPLGIPSLSIKVTVSGSDSDGNSVSETLHFTSATYNPATTSASYTMDHDTATGTTYSGTPGNYIRTATIFSEVDSWQIIERQNDGIQSVVTIFREHIFNGHLEVATVYFDGSIIERITDDRNVFRQLANNTETIKNLSQQYENNLVITGTYSDVTAYWSDDYAKWRYMDAKNTEHSFRNPWYSSIYPIIQDDGYFTTIPFNLEGATFNAPSFLITYGENVTAEIRGVASTSPTVWSGWTTLSSGNFKGLGIIISLGFIKIQFRFKATNFEGYSVIGATS